MWHIIHECFSDISWKGIRGVRDIVFNNKGHGNTWLDLFGSYVSLILRYASEMCFFSRKYWEFTESFWWTYFGVENSTSNSLIYGELGQYQLYTTRYIEMWNIIFNCILLKAIILHCTRPLIYQSKRYAEKMPLYTMYSSNN